MLNKYKLKAAIAEKGVSQKDVAEQLGISNVTFSRKMRNGSFGISEASVMIRFLQIKNPNEIFFADDVTSQVTKASV